MPATEPEPLRREHLERHDLDAERDAGDADAVVRRLRDRAGDVRAVAVVVVRVACCRRSRRRRTRSGGEILDLVRDAGVEHRDDRRRCRRRASTPRACRSGGGATAWRRADRSGSWGHAPRSRRRGCLRGANRARPRGCRRSAAPRRLRRADRCAGRRGRPLHAPHPLHRRIRDRASSRSWRGGRRMPRRAPICATVSSETSSAKSTASSPATAALGSKPGCSSA